MFRIGISDCGDKNRNYIEFLKRIQNSVVIILSKDSMSREKLDGLLLTGGADVNPELYKDWPDETVHVDAERDGFEFKLIEKALSDSIPIFGICRGLQVVNVYFGGTLIIDLAKYCNRFHQAISDNEDRTHGVIVNDSSKMKTFIKQTTGIVNSAHHQAADRIGGGLKIAARADDGTVEAIEGNGELRSKIVCVQWHPERMYFESPFATGALRMFESCLNRTTISEHKFIEQKNTFNGGKNE